MPSQMKSIMIGIFVISACSLIVFILLFLHPSVGDNAKTLKIRFADIDKINIGTRVTYAGRPVGEVIDIQEIEDARHQHVKHNGKLYVYELTLRVDSGVNIFNSDEVSVRTSGLLGEKNVAIIPLPPKSNEEIYLVDDRVLYSESSVSVEETVKDFGLLSRKFEKALDRVIETIDNIQKQKIVDNLGEAAQNINEITQALNKPEQWATMLANLSRLSERANSSWDSVDNSLDKFYAATTNFKEGAINFNQITLDGKNLMENVRRGEGTLGKLFAGDDLYLRLTSILSKGETTMGDINQYGLLFHTNKRWQREQAQRMNLLSKLSDPQTFSCFFNSELNQISSSLSHVTMALSEAEGQCPPQYLLLNPEFTSKFAELLRKFDKMQEELMMYNQQLMDSPQCAN